VPYPQRLLTEGETILVDLRPHWRTVALPVALVPLTVGLVSYALAAVPAGRYQTPGRYAVLAAGAVVLLAVSLRRWLQWRATRYVVTNHRVLVRRGALRRQGRDIPLNRITDVAFTQTLTERLFRAGTLLVESAGEHGRAAITDVPRVAAVQRTVSRLVQQAVPGPAP
jgi:uncharacterized membrane protein YdbT with pleckstrin-like domain